MKSIGTSFLLLSFFYVPLFAQSWFDGNPVWQYDYQQVCHTMINGWDQYRVIEDTVINGQDSKIVEVSSCRYEPLEEPSCRSGYNYFYEADQKVYYYQGGEFQLLYDFTLQPGDSVIINELNLFDDWCEENRIVLVLDTLTNLNIGEDTLTVQHFKLVNNLDYFGETEVQIIEKIGAVGSYSMFYQNDWSCFLDICSALSFACYSNESLGIFYPGNSSCPELVTSVEQPFEQPTILEAKIYPNPTAHQITIIYAQPISGQLQLVSSTGQVVYQQSVQRQTQVEWDISEFSNGIFLLLLSDEDGNVIDTGQVIIF